MSLLRSEKKQNAHAAINISPLRGESQSCMGTEKLTRARCYSPALFLFVYYLPVK